MVTPKRPLRILHVDMDAFYVSVELLRRPELRGQPVVVGGTGERGVVAAASYEARAHGVHSAMPSTRARRLCPQAVFLPGDHRHYAEVSARIMDLFRDVTPLVQPLSLDEAFLDVAGAARSHGHPPQIAHDIRRRVLDQEGLTCSVGVASVMFLAKLATEEAKPEPTPEGPRFGSGVYVLDPDRELDHLHRLPVRSLWGVGPKTLERLERRGVTTVGDLAALPEDRVVAALGQAHGRHLWQLAHGIDPRRVEPDQAPKSISQEATFAHDRHYQDELGDDLVRMCDTVAARLRASRVAARTIGIKVRFADFRTITRSVTLATAADTGHEVLEAARGLLAQVDPTPGVRLLGVSGSGLVDGGHRQLSLDDLLEPSWSDATEAVDLIRDRYGADAIGPASLSDGRRLRTSRPGDHQWGPDE